MIFFGIGIALTQRHHPFLFASSAPNFETVVGCPAAEPESLLALSKWVERGFLLATLYEWQALIAPGSKAFLTQIVAAGTLKRRIRYNATERRDAAHEMRGTRMCGRYGITMSAHEAIRRVSMSLDRRTNPDTAARYNVPPGTAQPVAIGDRDAPNQIGLDAVYWGFLPSWQTQSSKSSINMRVESADKSYWRKAFEQRRCAVIASWWYEWKKTDGGKQPFAIRPGDTEGFFFAGVWSIARGLPEDHTLYGQQTFAILTQPAGPDIADIHPRMPVALTDDGIQEWLSPGNNSMRLREMIAETCYRTYESWPVDPRVGNPANDEPAIIERRTG